MVFVMVRLFEIHRWVVFGEFDQIPIEVFPECVVDDGMSVFGRKHQVVVTEVDTVTCSSVFPCSRHRVTVSQGR